MASKLPRKRRPNRPSATVLAAGARRFRRHDSLQFRRRGCDASGVRGSLRLHSASRREGQETHGLPAASWPLSGGPTGVTAAP